MLSEKKEQIKLSDACNSIGVIVCTYDIRRYPDLKEAINSILRQTYKLSEIIIVSSGNPALRDHIKVDFENHESIKVIYSETSLSATQARNAGIKIAKSDIIAFTDDDVIVDKDWAFKIIDTYKKTGAIAVGGKVMAVWPTGTPSHLPEELYWLVGVYHVSFLADRVQELRNTWGPNMSFRKEVFDIIGDFNENLGFAERGTSYIQGEEPEFGLRIRNHFGRGFIYNPEAIVYHKIYPYKLKANVLFKRSYYQGYTKALIQRKNQQLETLQPEKSYLLHVISTYVPQRIKNLVLKPGRFSETKKFFMLITCVLLVGIGFVYGYLKYATIRKPA